MYAVEIHTRENGTIRMPVASLEDARAQHAEYVSDEETLKIVAYDDNGVEIEELWFDRWEEEQTERLALALNWEAVHPQNDCTGWHERCPQCLSHPPCEGYSHVAQSIAAGVWIRNITGCGAPHGYRAEISVDRRRWTKAWSAVPPIVNTIWVFGGLSRSEAKAAWAEKIADLRRRAAEVAPSA